MIEHTQESDFLTVTLPFGEKCGSVVTTAALTPSVQLAITISAIVERSRAVKGGFVGYRINHFHDNRESSSCESVRSGALGGAR
jgi:hypothetical protein